MGEGHAQGEELGEGVGELGAEVVKEGVAQGVAVLRGEAEGVRETDVVKEAQLDGEVEPEDEREPLGLPLNAAVPEPPASDAVGDTEALGEVLPVGQMV